MFKIPKQKIRGGVLRTTGRPEVSFPATSPTNLVPSW